MGRELKRVLLNFSWPEHQVWKGYLNPYYSQHCKSCNGSGLNSATNKLKDEWYSLDKTEWTNLGNGKRYNNLAWQYHLTEIEVKALLDAERLWDFTRIPINEEQRKIVQQKIKNGGNSWLPYNNGYIPTPEEVNEWAINGFGHDSLNSWICVKARAKHLGIYGTCKYCKGEGEIWQSEEIKKLHEEWKEFEPPEGDGYQLWETTTEGSPISPVFPTLKELCNWCENNASTFGSNKTTSEKWYEMLNDDFVCHKENGNIFL
jgi:hypothetical protein